MKSMKVLRDATGLSLGEVKRLVHESPVWDDRRAGDEAVQESFLRAMFVLCVLGEADITAPAEDVAAGLPAEALHRYHELTAACSRATKNPAVTPRTSNRRPTRCAGSPVRAVSCRRRGAAPG